MFKLNPRKVCFVTPTYFYMNPRSMRIAKALSQQGYFIDVICFNDTKLQTFDFIEMDNVNVYPINIERKKSGKFQYIIEYLIFSFLAFIKLVSLFQKHKHGIMHINNPPDTLVFITIFHKILFKVNVILDISEPLSKSFAKKFTQHSSIFIKFLDKLQLISAKYADRVITVSEAFKRELLRIGISDKNMYILINSPDDTFYIQEYKNTSKSDFGYNDRYIVLYQGSISNERGIDRLVDAIEMLEEKIPNVLGIIAGWGNQIDLIKKKIKEKKLNDYFVLTGHLQPKEVPKYVAISDICLLMALKIPVYELYSPYKLFEYMIYKKIIIAPKLAGITDIAGDNGCLYYEPGNAQDLADKILFTYLNTNKHKEFIERSQDVYEKYKWDVTKLELFKCYDSLK